MNTETQKLSFDDFITKALKMKKEGKPVEFNHDCLDDFQSHLMSELKKGIPDNFNEFLLNKINQMQGLLSYDEYTRWFLFQILIHTRD